MVDPLQMEPPVPMKSNAQKREDLDLLARTLWGEGRSEGRRGMTAIANVIKNRMYSKRAPTIGAVILEPHQFSAWNPTDPNRPQMEQVTEEDPKFRLAQEVARQALDTNTKDPTAGATNYHTLSILPEWANSMDKTVELGRHAFYRPRSGGRGGRTSE